MPKYKSPKNQSAVFGVMIRCTLTCQPGVDVCTALVLCHRLFSA
jgi:hypothetical protein